MIIIIIQKGKKYNEFHIKIEEQKKIEQKIHERNLTSLNMNSEQRLTQFKQYIGKLDENVEKNMEYHKQYLHANGKSHHNTSDTNLKNDLEQYSTQIPKHNLLDNKIEEFPSNKDLEEKHLFNDQNNSINSSSNNVFNKHQNSYESDLNKPIINEGNEDHYKNNREQWNANQINSQDYLNRNTRNYQEYYNVKYMLKQVKRDYLNFNKNIIDNRLQHSINMKEEKKRIAEERMKEVIKSYN